MPRIYDAGAAGRFEVPDDATDAEIQAALSGTNAPAPTAAIVPPSPVPAVPVPRRVRDTISRYSGYVAGSPTVSAVGNAASGAYDLAKRGIESDPRFQAGRTLATGANMIQDWHRATPGLVYAGFQRVVPPIAAAAGRLSVAAEPIIRAATWPVRMAQAGVEELAARTVVPAALAARDVVRSGVEREANYWRGLRPPQASTTEGTPVARTPQGYPKAPSKADERVPWQVYRTEKMGPMMWTGTGWVEPTEFR